MFITWVKYSSMIGLLAKVLFCDWLVTLQAASIDGENWREKLTGGTLYF